MPIYYLHVNGFEMDSREYEHVSAFSFVVLRSGVVVVDVALLRTWMAFNDLRFGSYQKALLKWFNTAFCNCANKACPFKKQKVYKSESNENPMLLSWSTMPTLS